MKKTSPRLRIPEHTDEWILFCAWVLLLFFALGELLRYSGIEPFFRTFLVLLICLIFYLGGLLQKQRTKDVTPLRRCFGLFFVLYLYLILTFTLLDPSLGRAGDSVYDQVHSMRSEYMERFFNPVPFRSIYHVYIRGFFRGYVNGYYTFLNLIGNVCAFMPLAFFLPYHFPAQRKWYFFLPTQILLVVLIESLQFLFMVGSCDVDDLILNAGGAFLCFFFLKIPSIGRLVKRLTGEEANKKS